MRNWKKLIAVSVVSIITVVFSAVAGYCTEIESYMAYAGKNQANALNGRITITNFKIKVKNVSDNNADYSMILAKFSGGVCKGIMIADSIPIEADKSEIISLDVTKADSKGIDEVKFVIVEIEDGQIYPTVDTVKKFSAEGWE